MFGLVDSSDSSDYDSDDNNDQPHIDERSLKHKQEVLKSDEYIVDIPNHCELHNLQYKQRPKSDSNCVCESKLKYKDCCMKIDKSQK